MQPSSHKDQWGELSGLSATLGGGATTADVAVSEGLQHWISHADQLAFASLTAEGAFGKGHSSLLGPSPPLPPGLLSAELQDQTRSSGLGGFGSPATPSHGSSGIAQLGSGQFLSPHSAASLPHTPVKAFDSVVSSVASSAFSSPAISAGSAPPMQHLPWALGAGSQTGPESLLDQLRNGGALSGLPQAGALETFGNSAAGDAAGPGALLHLLQQDPKLLDALLGKPAAPTRPSLDVDAGAVHGGLSQRTSLTTTPDWSSLHTPAAPSASNPSGLSAANLESVSSVQQVLSSHLLQEFTNARNVLVQLMLSAYAFLNSDSIQVFYDMLTPLSRIYDEMHDLPVVQKRKRCADMLLLRGQLLQDSHFTSVLQAICALRHHLHSLSRKVLVMNQGPDGIPIDLLLGSMSSELYHVMKAVLPQEVLDFFGNNLPHPKLALLVFAQFTTVDPDPGAEAEAAATRGTNWRS